MSYITRLYLAYIWNLLVGIDQLCAVIFWGADPDETISSITAKLQYKPFYHWLGNIIELIDPGHLQKYIEHDEGCHSIFNRIKR